MRFPSLFRLPRHQQFHIQPRYYDPVKEEIKERTKRIREETEGKESTIYQPSKISFKRRAKSTPNTSLLQLGIAAFLGILIVGWLQFGGDFLFYLLWVIFPVYLFYRVRSFRKRRK
ncbi:MAG: hypothetical protein AAGC64_09640 [Bacteroidota bacterium]